MRRAAAGLLSLLALAGPAAAQENPVPVIRAGPAQGGPHGRGAAIAHQAKARFPDLERRYDAFLAQFLTQAQADAWIQHDLQGVRDAVADSLRAEIEGVADGLHLTASDRLGDGDLSLGEFWLLQAVSSLIPFAGGAAFAVEAPLTVENATLAGRVHNGPAALALRTLTTITMIDDGDVKVGLIGPAGMLGAVNAFNDHGVFAALIDGPETGRGSEAEAGARIAAFDLRQALAEARHGDGVVSRLNGGWRRGWSVFIADPDQARVLEAPIDARPRLRRPTSDARQETIWRRPRQIAAVRCFILDRNPANCHDLGDLYRWRRLRDLAVFRPDDPKARLNDLIAILSDKADRDYAMNGPETAALIAFETQPPTLYLGMLGAAPRRYGGLITPKAAGFLAGLLKGVWLGLAATIALCAAALLYARFKK